MLDKALRLLIKSFLKDLELLRNAQYKTVRQKASYSKKLDKLISEFVVDYKDLLDPVLQTQYKKSLNQTISSAIEARGKEVQKASFRKGNVPDLNTDEFWARFSLRISTIKNNEIAFKQRETGIQLMLEHTDLEELDAA
jgi:hypothetical protein